jgi:ubiquinone/menaquinone biosynthesis C-methylase UbiE
VGKNYKRIKERFENTYSGFASWYDEYYGEWMKYSTNRVLSQIKIHENPVCLDVACGTGISTFELVKACNNNGTFYGIDISQEMITLAEISNQKKGFNVKFQQSDAENLKFPDSMFDFVLCNMSLPYFPDKKKVLTEVYRVMKLGGQYAFTYNGGPSYQEGIELGLRIALDFPNIPDFYETVMDTKNMFIDLNESVELFESVGFDISNIYGKRGITHSEPDLHISDKNTFWATWSQAIPPSLLDIVKAKLLNAAKAEAHENGFKYTTYEIFVWGKKEK